MRPRVLGLLILGALAMAGVVGQEEHDGAAPTVAAAEAAAPAADAAAEQGGGHQKKREEAFVLLLLLAICAPAALVALIAVRTAVSLGLAAIWPGATERGGDLLSERPWLALGWGAFLALFVLALFQMLQSAGGAAGLLAVLLLLITILAGAVGSTCLCEWLGGRLYALMPHREPSRCGRLVLGSAVLPLLLITPPGWLAFPFVAALSLGTCRLALGKAR